MFSGIKRFILWDYSRGSWQYDVMVGLIVLFVFFTPRAWFRDQPRIPLLKETVVLPDGSRAFWVAPELVRETQLDAVLKQKYKKSLTVTQLEPIYDSEHEEIIGYTALAR